MSAHVRIDELPVDDERGTLGMKLAILTEALLFVVLFFAYFYIGHDHALEHWPHEPPKLMKPLMMLGLLLVSSAVLHAGEHVLKKGKRRLARVLVVATIVLGVAFLLVQTSEYRARFHEVLPTTNAYGSLFYVITSFHAAHLIVGLLMLLFVLALPALEPRSHAPHKPLHNAALYWHFVDAVWVVVVALLYLLPNVSR